MNKVVIVGAGPAGLSAAITCAEKGMEVVIIDEYMKAGGRLLGQLYEEPDGNWFNGIKEGRNLYEKAVALGVEFYLRTPVNNMEVEDGVWTIYTENLDFKAKYVVLATGASEAPLPVPGWTLPGVMSVGAAQVMTNVHRVKPGTRGVIIGVNVLSAAIAMELHLADVEVVSLTLPKKNEIIKEASNPKDVMESLLHVSHMAPSKFVKYGSNLMKSDFMKSIGISLYPKKGVRMWGTPIQLRKAVTEIYGTDKVEGVKLASVSTRGEIIAGSERSIPVDFVCIAGGLSPLVELVSIAGCPFCLVEELGGYIPLHNNKMETPVEGLYVAGNVTGIEGAKVAIAQGRTAGLSVFQKSGGQKLEKEIEESVQSISQARKSSPIQFHPEIESGRKKIAEQWDAYYLKNNWESKLQEEIK